MCSDRAGTNLGLAGMLRATILFPLPYDEHKSQYRKELRVFLGAIQERWGGLTRTPIERPIIEGFWFDERKGQVVQDRHCLVIVDVPEAHRAELQAWLVEWKTKLLMQLREEMDLWIVLHEAEQIARPFRREPLEDLTS